MSELIETTLKTAAAEGKNTLRHDIAAELDGQQIISACLTAWGSALQVSRAAPSWSRVEPYIGDFERVPADLVMVVDHEGAGAISMAYSSDQRQAIGGLLNELKELAVNVGADAAAVSAAQTAFEDKARGFEFAETFTAGMGPLSVSSFVEHSEAILDALKHSEFGEIETRDLHAIAKAHAMKPQALLEEEAAAAAAEAAANGSQGAQAQSQSAQAAQPKRYSSIGQIVKANDVPALTKTIQDYKELDRWDESMIESVTKLLWHTAQMGHVDIARVLIDEGGATLEQMNSNGVTPLLAACAGNQPAMIEFLMERGGELTETTVDGKTPLMLAAESNAVEAVKKLVEELGVDIDETALDGRTALHFAAIGVNDTTADKAIEALMELGANPTLQDQISGDLPEEYISEEFDTLFANLSQYRKDWESGAVKPRTSTPVSRARAILGF